MSTALAQFRGAYGQHRAAEGRALSQAELDELPYLRHGPLARQWQVRARTYQAFLAQVLAPLAQQLARPLGVLDLGAGSGWLCRRVRALGHQPVALDVRDDDIDGLRADHDRTAGRVCASFETLPLADCAFDLVVFSASLHYALDLSAALAEARRVTRTGGRIAILDSPFYRREADGRAMVAEKHRAATVTFGVLADALLALPFIEFLTPRRLAAASRPLGLRWRQHRVRYPLWYELRPLRARIERRRPPSRFDLWECDVA
jgi:SAM-dependent methyltransferase